MSEIKKKSDINTDSGQDYSEDFVYAISFEFERDSRRYNRAFTEESEVGSK